MQEPTEITQSVEVSNGSSWKDKALVGLSIGFLIVSALALFMVIKNPQTINELKAKLDVEQLAKTTCLTILDKDAVGMHERTFQYAIDHMPKPKPNSRQRALLKLTTNLPSGKTVTSEKYMEKPLTSDKWTEMDLN